MIKIHAIDEEDSRILRRVDADYKAAMKAEGEARNKLHDSKRKVIEKFVDNTARRRGDFIDSPEPYQFDEAFEHLIEKS